MLRCGCAPVAALHAWGVSVCSSGAAQCAPCAATACHMRHAVCTVAKTHGTRHMAWRLACGWWGLRQWAPHRGSFCPLPPCRKWYPRLRVWDIPGIPVHLGDARLLSGSLTRRRMHALDGACTWPACRCCLCERQIAVSSVPAQHVRTTSIVRATGGGGESALPSPSTLQHSTALRVESASSCAAVRCMHACMLADA
eukprot:jgi/Ulvmu1/8702/UM047_0042.1